MDVAEIADIRIECRKPFRGGDNCQCDAWCVRGIGEDRRRCCGLIGRQCFGVEDDVERCFSIRSNLFGCCDFGVTAACVDVLDTERPFAYVSCCYGACYGAFPFWKRAEVNPLLRED